MTFEPIIHQLAFVLPQSCRKGDVTFCSVPDGQSIRYGIGPIDQPRHVVSTAQLTCGRWRARLQWSDGHHQYYEEKEIFVDTIPS